MLSILITFIINFNFIILREVTAQQGYINNRNLFKDCVEKFRLPQITLANQASNTKGIHGFQVIKDLTPGQEEQLKGVCPYLFNDD